MNSHAEHPEGHAHHDAHEGHSPDAFRDKFWLSLALTLPVVYWSAHIQRLLGYQALVFPGAGWIPPVLGTAVFVYGGWVFLQGAWRELAARRERPGRRHRPQGRKRAQRGSHHG